MSEPIDWLTPEIGVIAEYFEYVWIRTLQFDNKEGHIEQSVARSEMPGLEMNLDFRTDAQYRSVSGYCVFGIAGHNRDALAPTWHNKSSGDVILWGPTYFLNWKETFITPPRGFNAIRIWGRADSHFYCYSQTYNLDDMLNEGKVKNGATGQQVYPLPGP